MKNNEAPQNSQVADSKQFVTKSGYVAACLLAQHKIGRAEYGEVLKSNASAQYQCGDGYKVSAKFHIEKGSDKKIIYKDRIREKNILASDKTGEISK